MRKAFGLLLTLFLSGAVGCGVGAAYVSAHENEGRSILVSVQATGAGGLTGSTGSTGSTGRTGTPLNSGRYYTNGDGHQVHAPAKSSNGIPTGAKALCRDRTYSFSQHRQGTCSHHGGVARWL